MKRIGQIAAGIGAALAGMCAAVFLHPRAGGRNRHAAAGLARRRSANVAAIVGTSMSARPGGRRRAQVQLAADVRAGLETLFGEAATDVRVTTDRGTVTLRGEVSRLDDIGSLEAATRDVDGVAEVNNLLRLRSTPRTTTEANSTASAAP